jgi:hypothetical protein
MTDEGGTTPAPPSPPGAPADRLKNGIGIFLVVFVAALNFLGLRDAEMTSVLRNSPETPPKRPC